jgi:hypothetical protein
VYARLWPLRDPPRAAAVLMDRNPLRLIDITSPQGSSLAR